MCCCNHRLNIFYYHQDSGADKHNRIMVQLIGCWPRSTTIVGYGQVVICHRVYTIPYSLCLRCCSSCYRIWIPQSCSRKIQALHLSLLLNSLINSRIIRNRSKCGTTALTQWCKCHKQTFVFNVDARDKLCNYETVAELCNSEKLLLECSPNIC